MRVNALSFHFFFFKILVFGDTIYSPELFSDPNKTVESDDTTVCDNISDTLIAFDNENEMRVNALSFHFFFFQDTD
jgi:hypothetical protein